MELTSGKSNQIKSKETFLRLVCLFLVKNSFTPTIYIHTYIHNFYNIPLEK